MSWKIAYHSVEGSFEDAGRGGEERGQTSGSGRRAVGRSAEMEVAGEQEQEQRGGLEQKHWAGGCLDPLGCTSKGGGREQKVPNCVPETEELPHRRAKQGSGVTGSSQRFESSWGQAGERKKPHFPQQGGKGWALGKRRQNENTGCVDRKICESNLDLTLEKGSQTEVGRCLLWRHPKVPGGRTVCGIGILCNKSPEEEKPGC